MDSCLRLAILVGSGFPFSRMSKVAKYLSFERNRFTRPEGDMIIIDEAIDIAMGVPSAEDATKQKRGRPTKNTVIATLLE